MARRRGYSGIPDIYDRWTLISPNQNSPQSKFDGALAVTQRHATRRPHARCICSDGPGRCPVDLRCFFTHGAAARQQGGAVAATLGV